MARLDGVGFLDVFFHLFLWMSHSIEGCPPHELKALLVFKVSLNESAEKLKSWEGNDCCVWRGVYCDNIEIGGHVTQLDLSGLQLSTVSDHIDSSLFLLKHLKHLDLSGNKFEGIPIPQGLGSLTSLTYLSLSTTMFQGVVPPQLGNLSSLLYLNLEHSSDSFGYDLEIPSLQWMSNLSSLEFLAITNIQVNDRSWGRITGSLSHLKHLELSGCALPGTTIPIPLVNLSSLAFLDLSYNAFVGIPSWIGNMSKLTILDLSRTSLNGSIPDSITELGFLARLDLHDNNIVGAIPQTIGNLTNLKYFDLGENMLSGSIPSSFGDIHSYSGSLSYLSLSDNKLQGVIPASLGHLTNLTLIDLSSNQLGGSIPPSIGNLSSLDFLMLDGNQLSGGLPQSFSRLSSLTYVDVSGNLLSGSIPSALPSSLWRLQLRDNNLMSGTVSEAFFQNTSNLRSLELPAALIINISSTWIPPFQLEDISLSRCTIGGPIPSWISTQYLRLRTLDLSGTKLVGNIPSWLWDVCSRCSTINLSDNHLEGPLAPTGELLGPGEFVHLDLSKNELSGHIPADINMHFTAVIQLSLADNKLEGPIPASVGNMGSVLYLDMSKNRLTGIIPDSFGNTIFYTLLLADNELEGSIPASLGSEAMRSLKILDLSKNRLRGNIPPSLGNALSLEVLNLEKNTLEGDIPANIGKPIISCHP